MTSPRLKRWGDAFFNCVQDKGIASQRLIRWGSAFFILTVFTPWMCLYLIGACAGITSLTQIGIIFRPFLILTVLCDGGGLTFIVLGRTNMSRRLFYQGVFGLSIGVMLTGMALSFYFFVLLASSEHV